MIKFLILVSVFPALWLFYRAISWHARRRLADIQGIPGELVTTRINRTFPKALLKAAEKVARESALPPDEPPLRSGDRCLLLGDIDINGAGPLMVVDTDETHVVVAWDDGCQEVKMPRAVVRRCIGGERVSTAKISA